MRNIYDYYITPDEYDEAERNGISPITLTERIRKLAWDKRRAITTPVRIKRDRSALFEIAKRHGISRKILHTRLYRGWDELRASTLPVRTAEQSKEQGRKLVEMNRKYPLIAIEFASSNGIKVDTFRRRIKAGWGIFPAATVQPSPANGHLRVIELFGENTYFRQFNKFIFK